MKLVECIPNFSEGRRAEIIEAIVESIRRVPGVSVLDLHSDTDHNRSVVTFVGVPDAVLEAAFASIAQAAALIDMDAHQGEHPRIGAADVVPFVPLSGVTMADCVGMARTLGERVGRELNIPVYLYEAAAARPNRQNLANLRRGEYEGLKVDILTDPDRQPDYGPAALGKAGATVIGARPPLIAYNVYLTTDDVDIARRIARNIRYSGGGLANVKALGMFVKGRAQISMNLTDHTQTPIARVVEMIRREAQRYGVGIHHAELVGLIPQVALIDAACWYLQLDEFENDQVLETRLYAALHRGDLSDRLAQGEASSLSAAAYNGSMAASLVSMAARLTLTKKKYTDQWSRMSDITNKADSLRLAFEKAMTKDGEISAALREALLMPHRDEVETAARTLAVERAAQQVMDAALEISRQAVSVLDLAVAVAEHGTLSAAADLGAVAVLVSAALQTCRIYTRAQLARLSNSEALDNGLNTLNRLENEAQIQHERIVRANRERANINL